MNTSWFLGSRFSFPESSFTEGLGVSFRPSHAEMLLFEQGFGDQRPSGKQGDRNQ